MSAIARRNSNALDLGIDFLPSRSQQRDLDGIEWQGVLTRASDTQTGRKVANRIKVTGAVTAGAMKTVDELDEFGLNLAQGDPDRELRMRRVQAAGENQIISLIHGMWQ